MMQVYLVPPALVPDMWPKVFRHFQRASEYTFGRYEPEDIMEYVLNGHAHLWVVIRESESDINLSEDIIGVTVTRFVDYPRKRCLDMVFLGGDDGFSWKDSMLGTLRNWAKDSECEVIESTARPGFARAFRNDGYRMLWQVYELPVDAPGIGVSNG
jgi:hypothetical protein